MVSLRRLTRRGCYAAEGVFGVYLNSGLGPRAITTARVDQLALVRRGANAAAVAAVARVAALRLALVILENEQVVLPQLDLGATERLIRGGAAPLAIRARLQNDSIKRADLLILVLGTCSARAIVGEAFTLRAAATEGILAVSHVANKTLARRQECRRRRRHHKNIRQDQEK